VARSRARSVEQFYDPVKAMFLPDRYVKGECPKCGTADQYGDNCENCGATYAPTDLKNPYSVVSGARPEMRASEHYFFELAQFQEFLTSFLRRRPRTRVSLGCIRACAQAARVAGCRACKAWDISRDAPYFGFEIPDAPGKYFYVWLDAPIGYLASFRAYCDRTGVDYDHYLMPGSPPNCIISSARTSSTSTGCSGRRCCTAPATARPPRCTSTAT
jgi:methionyl-tRNA synthetase